MLAQICALARARNALRVALSFGRRSRYAAAAAAAAQAAPAAPKAEARQDAAEAATAASARCHVRDGQLARAKRASIAPHLASARRCLARWPPPLSPGLTNARARLFAPLVPLPSDWPHNDSARGERGSLRLAGRAD